MSSRFRRARTERDREIEREVDECYKQRREQLRREAADREEVIRNAREREEERFEVAKTARANRR